MRLMSYPDGWRFLGCVDSLLGLCNQDWEQLSSLACLGAYGSSR